MAKVKTIGTVAFGIAAGACIPITIFEILKSTEWHTLIITVALCFFSILIFAQFFIKRYVVFKIKPIFRMVTSKNISTEEIYKQYKLDGDFIGEIEQELSSWTEKREAERNQFKESERFRKEFVGNVSHEIKTPVFTIMGYITTLMDGGLEDPEINRIYLERAGKNLERLTNILTDLDQITALETGGKLEREVFDMKQLVREVFSQLEWKADKYHVHLKMGPTGGHPVLVDADRGRIEQVLINLIANSIRYGKSGGTTLVNFIDLYEEVLIEVQDDGIGIMEKDQKRIFERFYRVDKSRSRDEGGTGLGLSIVKHIIDAHETQLVLRSQPGEGSTFSFTLQKPPK